MCKGPFVWLWLVGGGSGSAPALALTLTLEVEGVDGGDEDDDGADDVLPVERRKRMKDHDGEHLAEDLMISASVAP